MNEITELFLEHKAITNEPISAAILVLAEVIKSKRTELDKESIDYLFEAFKNT